MEEFICKTHGAISPDRVHTRPNGHRYCKDCNNASVKRTMARKSGAEIPYRPTGKNAEIGDTSIKNGYVIQKVGFDKTCHHRANTQGWVYQHILIAEEKYGFPITREYTVHHINRNQQDNRPENLELRVGNHGKGGDLLPTLLSSEENREIAADLLRQYGYVIQ